MSFVLTICGFHNPTEFRARVGMAIKSSKAWWMTSSQRPSVALQTSAPQEEIWNVKLVSFHEARVVCVSAITFLYDYLCPIKIQLAYETMVFSFMVMKRMMLSSARLRVLNWKTLEKCLICDWSSRWKCVTQLTNARPIDNEERTFHVTDNRWNIKKRILLLLLAIYVVDDDSILKSAETWSLIKAHCVVGRIIIVMAEMQRRVKIHSSTVALAWTSRMRSLCSNKLWLSTFQDTRCDGNMTRKYLIISWSSWRAIIVRFAWH